MSVHQFDTLYDECYWTVFHLCIYCLENSKLIYAKPQNFFRRCRIFVSRFCELKLRNFLISPYQFSSSDGSVRNKLPGKLFLYSIIKEFLCIIHTYFLWWSVAIHCLLKINYDKRHKNTNQPWHPLLHLEWTTSLYGACVFLLCMRRGWVFQTTRYDEYWWRYSVG